MNKAALKSYGPQVRKDFISAVTARADLVEAVTTEKTVDAPDLKFHYGCYLRKI